MKKEYIIAGIGSLIIIGAFLYYKRRSSIRTGGSGSGGGTGTTGDSTSTGTDNVTYNNLTYLNSIIPPFFSAGNDAIPESIKNTTIARKNCARKGGTWQLTPNGYVCINIPAPTTSSLPTGVIHAPVIIPRSSGTSSSSSSNDGGAGGSGSSGSGSMALPNLGGMYDEGLGSYGIGSYGIDLGSQGSYE